jgi:branched-chain amino acid transport system substrate-binding protein
MRTNWGSLALAALFVAMLDCGQAAAQQKPVRIGVLGDQSSLGAAMGGQGSVVAAKLAVEDAKGTVLNRPIEVLTGDTLNKPDVSSALAGAWFERDDVSAIVDLPFSAVALAVMNVGNTAKRTVMVAGATTADLTGKACSAYGSQWSDDNWTLVEAIGKLAVQNVGKSWYFVTLDATFGNQIRDGVSKIVTDNGGTVVGGVRFPINTPDFSSFVLQAQASKAQVIALASAGADTVNAVKQASEFGIVKGGQRIVSFLTLITDVHSLGLDQAQGMVILESFYWDQNDEARAFSRRFFAAMKAMPSKEQAAVYAATAHFLKAVAAAGTDDAAAVNKKMREIPVNFLGRHGTMRADGRVMVDVSLYQVKAPSESKQPWDYYKELAVLPKEQAYHPLDGSCATAGK